MIYKMKVMQVYEATVYIEAENEVAADFSLPLYESAGRVNYQKTESQEIVAEFATREEVMAHLVKEEMEREVE